MRSTDYNRGMSGILVVEDDKNLREGLVYALRKQDYEVHTAEDGYSALEVAREVNPDLILLDVLLPNMDGFQVCKTLRTEMNCPILMVTAKSDEIDRVLGLEIGADDYIVKPFSMRELLARVKAHLRHERLILNNQVESGKDSSTSKIMTFGNLTIDTSRQEVFLNGLSVNLKPKEYQLLVYMAQHTETVLTREQILQDVWGWQFFKDTHTVDMHVHGLREVLEKDPKNPTRIVTVQRAGYRFEGS